MDSRSSFFYLGFPLGTWFRTRVRVSIWFPLLVVVCVQRLHLNVGLAVSAILFFSVLIHEFAHVFTARATGGEGDEILIWPLGGLAYTKAGPTISSEFLTAAAGPISNLLLWLLSVAILTAGRQAIPEGTFSLIDLPRVDLREDVFRDILVLVTAINFKLMCLNLVPAVPLDGGQMAFSLAKTRWEPFQARIGVLQLGMAMSVIVALVGVFLEDTFPVLLAFALMAYNLQEYIVTSISRQLDDPMLAGDFGAGASWRSEDEEERRPGMIERWRRKRAAERQQREEAERAETEQKLDALLDKVHREGMNSLSEPEKRFLARASARYRSHEH